MYCIDCGKQLGVSAFYGKAKRCVKCCNINKWQTGKMDTVRSGKFGRKSKTIVCPICSKKVIRNLCSKQKYCSNQCKRIEKSVESYYRLTKLIENKGRDWVIWFTGFWEGEGSLCREFNKLKNKYTHFTFSVAQKDKICDEFKKYFRIGKVNNYFKGGCKAWMFGGVGYMYAFVKQMLPYILITKRKKQIALFLDDKYLKEVIKCLENR
jgi:hypothetical protein